MEIEDIKHRDSGIYKIVNLINNKFYIGQSRSMKKRINNHKHKLRRGKHPNKYLQYSWNKYGESSFSFEIVEICDVDELYRLENKYINLYKSYDRIYGYNLTIPDRNMESFKVSEETKELLSAKKKKYSDEELIFLLNDFFKKNNRTPTTREDLSSKNGYPSEGTYTFRFGSMKNALIKAGIFEFVENKKLFERKIVTKEDIINNYSAFVKKKGRFPTSSEQKYTSESGLFPTSTVLKHFNSIEDLKAYFGYSKEELLKLENEEALISLKKLYEESDGYITSRTIDKSRITRSTRFYSKRFGSLKRAYELAGVVPKNKLEKPIVQLTKENVFLRTWGTALEASESLNIMTASINHTLKGRSKSSGGYKWMYLKDYEEWETNSTSST